MKSHGCPLSEIQTAREIETKLSEGCISNEMIANHANVWHQFEIP